MHDYSKQENKNKDKLFVKGFGSNLKKFFIVFVIFELQQNL